MSSVDAPVVNVTLVPFDAVYSVLSSFEPFKNTSIYPTVYDSPVNSVWPFVAVKLLTVLVVVGIETNPVVPSIATVIPTPIKSNVVTPVPISVPSLLIPIAPSPPPPVAVIVTLPVDWSTEIPEPAVIEVTIPVKLVPDPVVVK